MRTLIQLAIKSLVLMGTLCGVAFAQVGLTEIQGKNEDGPVTVFYPTDAPVQSVQRGPFNFKAALEATPKVGNRRLIVISHGSGGVPWVHSDLALRLAVNGFVVALPEHRGDNYKSMSEVGPPSWKRRPLEVSRAIDTLTQDPRFASLIQFDKVGMYGMSAGGHTALTLAGGKWSEVTLRKHCDAYIAEDFHTCAGPTTQLTGGIFDGFKKQVSLLIIRNKLTDARVHSHTDPRITAIVAGVPFAVDFDMQSLQAPAVSLAIITAAKDKWLTPRFHSDAVLAACKSCIHLGHFKNGGHGALLSPLPPGLTGLLAELLYDPEGFDRAESASMDQRITDYFQKQLLPSLQ